MCLFLSLSLSLCEARRLTDWLAVSSPSPVRSYLFLCPVTMSRFIQKQPCCINAQDAPSLPLPYTGAKALSPEMSRFISSLRFGLHGGSGRY
ncbi:hypothetical protein LZ31DRAFT_35920 [Colletotrichum somersetense]|nr:hypothetical protein LZ31DRAFT_35920 [Colletotrichum somersetense]